jgi:hypothetical protein
MPSWPAVHFLSSWSLGLAGPSTARKKHPTTSPYFQFLIPTTLTSRMAGWRISLSSISSGKMFSPPIHVSRYRICGRTLFPYLE